MNQHEAALNHTHNGADLAGQGKGGELAIVSAVLVQVADVNLDAGVVLSCDQLVGPRAASTRRANCRVKPCFPCALHGHRHAWRLAHSPLAGDVQIHGLALCKLEHKVMGLAEAWDVMKVEPAAHRR